MDTNIDFIGKDGAQGNLAQMVAGGLNVNQMRPYIGKDGKAYITTFKGGDKKNIANYVSTPIQTNATLRRDEWVSLDAAVLAISEGRLGGIADLVAKGLTYDIGNGMGSTVLEYHDISDALEAQMSMDGVSKAQGDRPEYSTNYLPLPIIHADYEINSRVLAASRTLGNPLDTTLAERAARKVSEKLENMLFTPRTYKFGGGVIYSYVNHPNRNKVNLTASWSLAETTGADIVADVLKFKQASINAKHYGPWALYIPTGYETKMDEDYSTAKGTDTIRQRILAIAGISDIKVIDTLRADTVVMPQMTSDVIRLVRGMGIQNVEWQTQGGLITKYKVMTIQVPQIRADQDGNSGIVHAGLALV